MNNLSNSAENGMLDWLCLGATPTRPTAPLRVALYSVMPNQETGLSGTELTGSAYARTNVTFTAAASGAVSNVADVTFPAASGNWAAIVGIAIWDSAGSPVMLWSGTLEQSITVLSGQTFKIVAGALTLSLN